MIACIMWHKQIKRFCDIKTLILSVKVNRKREKTHIKISTDYKKLWYVSTPKHILNIICICFHMIHTPPNFLQFITMFFFFPATKQLLLLLLFVIAFAFGEFPPVGSTQFGISGWSRSAPSCYSSKYADLLAGNTKLPHTHTYTCA